MDALTARFLLRELEDGWTLEVPGPMVENPNTGNLRPGPPVVTDVSCSVQQKLWTGQTEVGTTGMVDERVAVVHPPIPIPPDAALYSPRGERWNVAGEGIIRRLTRRRPVYSAVPVRRASEGDRHV